MNFKRIRVMADTFRVSESKEKEVVLNIDCIESIHPHEKPGFSFLQMVSGKVFVVKGTPEETLRVLV